MVEHILDDHERIEIEDLAEMLRRRLCILKAAEVCVDGQVPLVDQLGLRAVEGETVWIIDGQWPLVPVTQRPRLRLAFYAGPTVRHLGVHLLLRRQGGRLPGHLAVAGWSRTLWLWWW